MDNPRNDGGPAFPHSGSTVYGMSLRDWFAGQVLNGLYSSAENTRALTLTAKSISESTPTTAAKMAYEAADAMLKERSNGK